MLAPSSLESDFEAAWSRLELMLHDPGHFNTLFFFVGNDVSKQALFRRMEHTVTMRGQTLSWPLSEAVFVKTIQALALPPEPCEHPGWVNSWVRAVTAQVLTQMIDGVDLTAPLSSPQCRPALTVLELDDALPGRLHDALSPSAFSPELLSTASQAADLLRMTLLSRLNERRELLARHASLLIVLPSDWTKRAAQYAPDLWTVRLTSHYLKAQPTAQASLHREQDPIPSRLTASTLTEAHRRVAQRWLSALNGGEDIRSLVIADGWVAVQGSLYSGLLGQAHRLARAVLEQAYQRGSPREQMVSQNWLGDVLVRQGERALALEAFTIAKQVAEKLSLSDPSNSDWQRDLSVSFNKVAGILEAQGERAKALDEYKKSLTIREKLASSDPSNSDWQVDLVVSWVKLGGVFPGDDRSRYWNLALARLRALHSQGKLTAEQTTWIDWLELQLRHTKPPSTSST